MLIWINTWRGDFTGSNGPDRFIRDHNIRPVVDDFPNSFKLVSDKTVELVDCGHPDEREGIPRLTSLEGLANA